jgi:hypothetical protein
MSRYLIAALLIVLASSGCAAQPQQPAEQINPDTYAAAVTTENSQFEKTVDYQGADLKSDSDCEVTIWGPTDFCHERHRYFIRGWKDRSTGHLDNQLYVNVYYVGPLRLYLMANFTGGDPGQFGAIDTKVVSCDEYGNCDHTEDFGITLSTQFLRDHAQSGFAVQATAKSGSKTIFTVPASYVQGYLAAVGQTSANAGGS